MRTLAVIPARLGATRLPRKPLRLLAGLPLVVRVFQRVVEIGVAEAVVVATDSDEVAEVVKAHGGRAVLTSPDHVSGTHRVAEVARRAEFAQLCRRFGLPEPDRQVRRRGPDGVFHLDSAWSAYDAVVEIEGLHHLEAAQAMADASRQNELTIGNDRVVRIPVIGLRVDPDHYMTQVARLLQSGGWRPSTQRPKTRGL